jgi:dolichol-phosphate mannosyltransferase
MKSISVIFPTFDERSNIVNAILRAEATLGGRLLEIIVVDDDSPDHTWKVVADLKHPRVKLVRRKNERGLASAIANGVSQSSGDIVVWLDCDLGVPPEVLGSLIKQLEKYDIAIASRFVDGGQDQRAVWVVFCSYLINRFSQLLLGSGIKDYTSGVIALKREVLEEVSIDPRGFGEYFIEFVHKCARKGFSIVEVGYCYKDREGGYSKSTGKISTFILLGIQYGLRVLSIRFRNPS